MRSIIEKSKTLGSSLYAQLIIVVVAFLIMGISSFLFVSGIERRHLKKDAGTALAFAENDIVFRFLEYETFLSSFSETLRIMLLKNENEHLISEYMTSITGYMLRDNERIESLTNTHGYFFSWGGKYISSRALTQSNNFIPQNQPWFKPTVEAAGRIIISEPYTDEITKKTILTFSRYLTDNNGDPLSILCLDLELDNIFKHTASIDLTEGSYGVLLNKNLNIISHPEPFLIGLNLYNIDSGLASIAPELERGINIYERKLKNYMYDDSIVYFLKVRYDWYLGIVIPIHEYYRSMYNMAAFLIVLGSILALGLCAMLYSISLAKRKSDMRTRQKSNFLATMSHEIRTPLNAILGMTEIQLQNTAHPPSTSEAFIKINNSGNLLLNIINDILDLSKIESGKLELVPIKYEVASLINDIVQLNYIRYESKPIEFILEVDPNIPSLLVGDELRIKQILNNLLSNSFKYTDQGHVTLSVNAECVGRGGVVLVTLVFQVIDTGQGMTPEQISKLFDEYTRFNLEANRTTEGAGLGMTITKNLIDLMYGKINIKSAVGEGTTVTIRLPQKTDGIGIRSVIGKEMTENLRRFKHGNTLQFKKFQISHEYMPYGSVLIVDDVETNLYVAKGLMVPYGMKIDLATSGFEAIDKVKEGNVYDIIFMDHMMPKMDGMETTKKLREIGYRHPIVALTANALAGQAEVFLNNGFDGFISKPIDIRQLNVTLNKMIRDKQPLEVVKAAQKEKAEMVKNTETGRGRPQIDTQLAEIFARDGEKAIAVIESCIQKNLNNESDVHLFIINVHSMKSALANIGEMALSDIAKRLEQAGREKDINGMLTETHGFLEKLKKIIADIKSKEEIETIEDTEITLELLNEKLIVIKKACSIYDKKSAKTALNELREQSWSHNTKDLLNKIAEHLLHSEFDDAAALAEKYIR
jgi:signal transduction histidine kinase/DNA-binding response OmpR family regulator/uncharacterized protein YoxC